MAKTIIRSDKVFESPSPISQAVRAGNLIIISGQVSRDSQGKLVGKGDARAQATQVFENIRALLEAAGTSLDSVVKLTTYVTDMKILPQVNEAKRAYFVKNFPASATVQVPALASEDWLVEIEAIAVV